MNKKKIMILSVVLIMVMAASGTLAYLTDTAGVTNTFTVGNVDITLDEAKTDSEGSPVDEKGNVTDENGDPIVPEDAVRTEDGNNYHLIPGQEYVKDPTVTVKAGSAESYIRMILQVTNKSAVDAIIAAEKNGLTDYADLFDGWNQTQWLYEGFAADETNNTISFEFRYFEKVDGFEADGTKADVKLAPLFTKLVVPGFVNSTELAELQNCKVVVTGHAIQAAGFEETTDDAGVKTSAEDNAWAAFDAQETKK